MRVHFGQCICGAGSCSPNSNFYPIAPRDNTAHLIQTAFRPRAARPYHKLRKYYRNEIRAWELQQRKLAKAPFIDEDYSGVSSQALKNILQQCKCTNPIIRLKCYDYITKKRYVAGSYNKPIS
ncbi:predicted protein [Botrytis cinerea T4]|uniref:Uncharacterized protein n=1 Tax=Botryotinia fuckeliana (strain T4) TaxID=999810 RepID=G2YZ84_BOTF4|nr:predicted protein [Botrytis cinerea T4]